MNDFRNLWEWNMPGDTIIVPSYFVPNLQPNPELDALAKKIVERGPQPVDPGWAERLANDLSKFTD